MTEKLNDEYDPEAEEKAAYRPWQGKSVIKGPQGVASRPLNRVPSVRFSQADPPEQLDPGDDDRGTPDHRIDGLQRLLPAEPLDPFDQELKIGLYSTEIDVLGITSRHWRMVIVWHGE